MQKVVVSISYRGNPQDYKSFSRKSLLARCGRVAGTKLEFGDLSRLTLVVDDFVWVILGFDVEKCWKHDLDEIYAVSPPLPSFTEGVSLWHWHCYITIIKG